MTLLPADTWVMKPTNYEVLTLITCVPANVFDHRLVVRALPVETVVIGESGLIQFEGI